MKNRAISGAVKVVNYRDEKWVLVHNSVHKCASD